MARDSRTSRRRRRSKAAKGARSIPSASRAALDRVPAWLPHVAYAVVTLVLFREFVASDLMLFGTDTLGLGYAARDFYAQALATTGFPLWNPIILGGTPFLESLAGGDALHPISVALLVLLDTHRALGWKLVIHVFLAGVFMYAWLSVLGASRGASALGGLAFLLAPHFVTLVFPGHDGKLFVVAMTPALFASGEWFLRRGGLLPLSALAAVVAVVLFSTHFQMAYFLFGAMGAYMILRCVWFARRGQVPNGRGAGRGGEGRDEGAGRAAGWRWAGARFGAFLLFSVVGAGVAAVQLLPAVDYITEYSRRAQTTVQAEGASGLAYSSSWSLHPEEVVSLVVPEFIGSSVGTTDWTDGTYWGRNPIKYNHEYLGLVVLLLAALAFLRVPRDGAPGHGQATPGSRSGGSSFGGPAAGVRWFLLGVGLVALLFAVGRHTPVWRIFYEVLPGISLFRAPSMAIFLTGFAAATLAALGVDRAVDAAAAGEGRPILRVLAAAAGMLALAWVLAGSGALTSVWTSVLYPGIEPPKSAALSALEPHMVRGFGIATVLAGVLALLWWGFARGRLPVFALLAALAVLVAADQWRVDAAFIEVMDPRAYTAPNQNHRYLIDRLDGGEPFRLLSLVDRAQDVKPGLYGIELAAGHHPNDLGRYRELIGMEGSGVPSRLGGEGIHPNVLAILNIRYVLWPDAQMGPLEGSEPVSRATLADGRVVSSLHEVPTLPRARVVGEAVVVGEERTLDAVLDEGFDPTTQVVLAEQPPLTPSGPEVTGRAQWIERTPNRLVFEVEASGDALVVVGDNWFPAWTATVDGRETPVLRADHTLRAVSVPAGTHRVEMRYESPLLRAGLALSVVSLLVLGAAVLVDFLVRKRGAGVRTWPWPSRSSSADG